MSKEQKDFVPAGLFRRLAAFMIDVSVISMLLNIVFVIIAAIVFIGFGIPSSEDLVWKMHAMNMRQLAFAIAALVLVVLTMAAIWHLYFIYFEHVYHKTPGKKALSLSVVSLDGKALSFKQALSREVLRCYVDMLFILPGFISMLVTKKKQRIGDLATNTMVVYLPHISRESGFLYLSQAQYEFRLTKYKVLDASLEEANHFLSDAKALLLGQSVVPSLGEEFVNKILVVLDPTFDDAYEMKFRFVAEFLLQLRRQE